MAGVQEQHACWLRSAVGGRRDSIGVGLTVEPASGAGGAGRMGGRCPVDSFVMRIGRRQRVRLTARQLVCRRGVPLARTAT